MKKIFDTEIKGLKEMLGFTKSEVISEELAEGQEEQILQLAEAAVAGDQQAAAELGMMLAPMILQQVDAEMQGAEGGEAAPAAPEPVFRRGGKFVGAIK